MKTARLTLLFFLLTVSVQAAEFGIASFYGEELRGRPMANGAPFDPDALTCASWNYPLGTRLKVSKENKHVFLTVTDRGPARRLGRAIDLSHAAFKQLADPRLGLIRVKIEKDFIFSRNRR